MVLCVLTGWPPGHYRVGRAALREIANIATPDTLSCGGIAS
jgi:hypothetical protein